MKRRYTVIGLIALLLVMVLTMAACGDETTDTTTAPSSTETTAAPSTDTTGAGTDTTAAPGTDTTVAAGPATGEPIKIGFLNDVTGPAAAVAAELAKGVALEVEYVNAQGGVNGRPLEVITFDCKSDVPTALAGMKKLVNDDKVSMLIGPFTPQEQEPCAQLADEMKIPLLHAGLVGLDRLTADPQHQWGFGLNTGAITQAKAYEQMIKDNGWKKLIGIADVIGADQDILKYLKENEAASGYNLTIIPDIIQFTTTDFQPFLNKIMDAYNSEKPDAIFVTATSLATPSVYKGLRALGVTVPIVGTPTNDSPQVFALGPEAVEGLMFFDVAGMANVSALPDDFPLKEIEMDLLQRFQAKYDAPPTFFAAQGADFIKVVAAVMTTAGGDDKTKVQQAMLTLKDLPGYIGFIGFSPELTSEGVQRPITQWVIKDGKYEFVKVLQ
jgi:branched-chain amino acid transport system substrate-binding protein